MYHIWLGFQQKKYCIRYSMSNALEQLRKRLNLFCQKRGAKAEIRAKTGFSASQLDRYISGETVPGVDQLEKIAEALGVQPWELIKPEAALPTPQPNPPTVDALLAVIKEQEKRLEEKVANKNVQAEINHLMDALIEKDNIINEMILAAIGKEGTPEDAARKIGMLPDDKKRIVLRTIERYLAEALLSQTKKDAG